METFNGFGYRAPTRNIPSPYLVGGTSVQKRGKFTADSHYDPSVIDPQIGGLAILKQPWSHTNSFRSKRPLQRCGLVLPT
jgi:lysozyme family protein